MLQVMMLGYLNAQDLFQQVAERSQGLVYMVGFEV